MSFAAAPNEYVVHTHSDPYVRRPSSGDVEPAKRTKTNIYTITKSGLFLTDPDGKTTQVSSKGDWQTNEKTRQPQQEKK
jgi:hypothetical protein